MSKNVNQQKQPLLDNQVNNVEISTTAKHENEVYGKDKVQIDWFMTLTAFFFPAIGGAMFGYDIGATSGALVSLMSPQTSGVSWYDLNPLEEGAVVSMSLVGALVGSITVLFVGDRVGRRRELMVAALLYLIADVIVLACQSYALLIVGRLVYGIGIGITMHAAPAYIAETAPNTVRGMMISMKEAFIVTGMLLGYLASWLLVDTLSGWRYMYSVSGVGAVILGVGMWWLPPSPRWLALTGKQESTVRKALVRVRGKFGHSDEVLKHEFLDIMDNAHQERNKPSVFDFSKIGHKKNVRPLVVGLSLMVFQQITGQPSVLYYAADIFEQAGFKGAEQATGVSVILGAFKLFMTCVAVFTVERVGRRPLLLLGVSSMVLSLIVLGVTQTVSAQFTVYVSLAALLLYVGCYQASFGPIGWLIVGEIFPLEVRSQEIAIAVFTNFFMNFLVSLLLPSVQVAIGMAATYYSFAVIGAVAVACIFVFVPETKGKTMEEIESLWVKQ